MTIQILVSKQEGKNLDDLSLSKLFHPSKKSECLYRVKQNLIICLDF